MKYFLYIFALSSLTKLKNKNMPKIYYDKDGEKVYIKHVDYANQKIDFTKKESEAETFRGGYYETAVIPFLQTNFKEVCPEVMQLQLERNGYDDY